MDACLDKDLRSFISLNPPALDLSKAATDFSTAIAITSGSGGVQRADFDRVSDDGRARRRNETRPPPEGEKDSDNEDEAGDPDGAEVDEEDVLWRSAWESLSEVHLVPLVPLLLRREATLTRTCTAEKSRQRILPNSPRTAEVALTTSAPSVDQDLVWAACLRIVDRSSRVCDEVVLTHPARVPR